MSYDPKLYSALHQGSPGDEAFYQRVCEGTQTVLELGCGYGRILGAIAAPGRRVMGVELDEGLRLSACATLDSLPDSIDAEVRCGDMRAFEFEQRFDRILIPYSGFYCLLEPDDALSCLHCVRKHLAPGGELVFDAYLADAFHEEAPMDPDGFETERTELRRVTVEGVHYRVDESSSWDREKQRIDARYFYVPESGGAELVGEIPQRYWTSSQIEPLLHSAGLELLAMAGDFDGRPVDDPDADTLVVIAGRAPDVPTPGGPG